MHEHTQTHAAPPTAPCFTVSDSQQVHSLLIPVFFFPLHTQPHTVTHPIPPAPPTHTHTSTSVCQSADTFSAYPGSSSPHPTHTNACVRTHTWLHIHPSASLYLTVSWYIQCLSWLLLSPSHTPKAKHAHTRAHKCTNCSVRSRVALPPCKFPAVPLASVSRGPLPLPRGCR